MADVKKMSTGDRLRLLAEWFDQHPKAEVPYALRDGADFCCYRFGQEIKEDVHNIGPFRKEYTDSAFQAVVDVGGFTITYYASRGSVCQKKVVGTKEIPEQVIPEQVIPARVEEIVEWDCGESLLADDDGENRLLAIERNL